jgi:hypothetical protein
MDLTELSQALQDVDPVVWLVAAAVVVLLIVTFVLLAVRRRRRRKNLQQRYGSEYERVARRSGSRKGADQALVEREERRRSYEVRELEAGERDRLRARWEALQASFVDGPETAVRGAHDLIVEVATTKGYPREGDPLEDVSVDHPLMVDRYRSAQPEPPAADDGRAPATEPLRRAMLAARELFEAIVGREDPASPDASSAFRDLVEEDEEPHGDGRAEAPQTTSGAGASPSDPRVDEARHVGDGEGEAPLYGPDGRPLHEPAGRHRD